MDNTLDFLPKTQKQQLKLFKNALQQGNASVLIGADISLRAGMLDGAALAGKLLELSGVESDSTPVIKLHGDIDHPKTLVFFSSDFAEASELHEQFIMIVSEEPESPWIESALQALKQCSPNFDLAQDLDEIVKFSHGKIHDLIIELLLYHQLSLENRLLALEAKLS